MDKIKYYTSPHVSGTRMYSDVLKFCTQDGTTIIYEPIVMHEQTSKYLDSINMKNIIIGNSHDYDKARQDIINGQHKFIICTAGLIRKRVKSSSIKTVIINTWAIGKENYLSMLEHENLEVVIDLNDNILRYGFKN